MFQVSDDPLPISFSQKAVRQKASAFNTKPSQCHLPRSNNTHGICNRRSDQSVDIEPKSLLFGKPYRGLPCYIPHSTMIENSREIVNEENDMDKEAFSNLVE